MKKLIITLDIKYPKCITEITIPYMEKYAKKIDADFKIITERKYSNYSVLNEKFQVKEYAKDYDWTFFFDVDLLVHPDLFDITLYMEKDTTLLWSYFTSSTKFKVNDNFKRDGRDLGVASTMFLISDWNLDMLNFDTKISQEELNKQVFPYAIEKAFDSIDLNPAWGTDEYVLSNNIAKYGLKVDFLGDFFTRNFNKNDMWDFFCHEYMMTIEEKRNLMINKIRFWRI